MYGVLCEKKCRVTAPPIVRPAAWYSSGSSVHAACPTLAPRVHSLAEQCLFPSVHCRRVIGWAVSTKPDADLAIETLDMAYEYRDKPQLALFLSDQGSPVRQSPIPATTLALPDAAEYESPMERVFRSLKSERIP